VARDDAVVVQPQHRDHVANVLLTVDPSGAEALPAGEHRVIVDAALLMELAPELLREAKVRSMVAVQVADLAAANLERKLTPSAWTGLDAWPRRDFLRDPFTRRLTHLSASFVTDPPRYKFK
jgi:hypothetical protein